MAEWMDFLFGRKALQSAAGTDKPATPPPPKPPEYSDFLRKQVANTIVQPPPPAPPADKKVFQPNRYKPAQ